MKTLKKKYVGDLRIGVFMNWPAVYDGAVLIRDFNRLDSKLEKPNTKAIKQNLKLYKYRKR